MSHLNLVADALYHRLFLSMPVHGVVLLDPHGVVVDLNPVASSLLAVRAQDAVGRDAVWLLAALGFETEPEVALAQVRDGAVLALSGWVVPQRGGAPWWCEGTVAAIAPEDADGDPLGFAAVVRDATEERRRMVAAPEDESRFARALAEAPVWVFHQDAALRYTWVPAAIPALGVAYAEDALGRTDDELLGADAATPLNVVKQRVLQTGVRERAEIAVGEMTLDVCVEPLRDPPSGPVRGVACTVVDVTEHRQLEERLRNSRALLAEVEHLARVGGWEWDIASDTIQWSDGLFEIYGLTPETFDPRYAAREQRIHPDDRDRVNAAVAAALDTCSAIDMEYRIVRPDGRVRRVHGRAEVLVDDEGRPVRMAGTAQDVTEIRAAEEALEQTAAELGRRAAELHRVARRGPGSSSDVAALLGDRQLEILGLIADGLGNAEIAARLFLSEATVKWHVRQILRKLRVANRAEAAARYVRSGPAER